MDVCLDLETFRVLLHGPCVTPRTRLSTRQLRTLIRLFVLEAPANQVAVGCRRQSPYGRAI